MKELQNDENFIHNKFGYCYYSLEPSPIIYNLYVHPEYRRRGHSKTLLQYVINEIRCSGCPGWIDEIGIEAKPQENSIPFEKLIKYYENIGLKIIKESERE